MSVLRQLGIDTEVADRLRPYPNGAAAMQALSLVGELGVIGSGFFKQPAHSREPDPASQRVAQPALR
jgi:hypothetical protein